MTSQPTVQPTEVSTHKTTIVAVLLIVAIALAAFYYSKHHVSSQNPSVSNGGTVAQPTQDSPYAKKSFVLSTTMTGSSCTVNACSQDGSCIPLSGAVDSKTHACTLDKAQSTPEAQALLPIVAPN